MKKAKYGLLALAVVFFGVVIYQNMDHLRATHGFHFNMFFLGDYIFPSIANGVYYTAFFLLGLLISYFFSLSERFKNRQTIHNLTATIDSHRDVISSLEIELNSIKGRKMETTSGVDYAHTSQGSVS